MRVPSSVVVRSRHDTWPAGGVLAYGTGVRNHRVRDAAATEEDFRNRATRVVNCIDAHRGGSNVPYTVETLHMT